MKAREKPNILLIMDDQHRFDYLGCMGADFISTPNLDRLASRGIRFTNCFANSPVCVPSRISMASGLLPTRLGALDNNAYLPPHVITYYQRLRDHGYRVGCVGKLDLAKPDAYNGRYGDRPCAYQWGFTHPEECEGKMHAGRSTTPLGPYTHYLQERGLLRQFHEDYVGRAQKGFALSCHDSVLPADAVEDAYIGKKAAEWIDWVPEDFPWFYFVSFVGPHDPYDPPAEYADKYRNAAMPPAVTDSMEGKPGWIRRRKVTDDTQLITETRRQYCAATQLIDDQVGMILDALERRQMTDNTYVIFASDHGEMLGDHGLFQKSVPYEPSIRVPLFVTGPGIQGEQASDALVELIDLNPTLCEMAGLPPQQHIDGRSIFSLVSGQAGEHRKDVVCSEYNFRCLRTERYKLIENFNDVLELYDLQEDPHELFNIAEKEPETVHELRQRMKKRLLGNVTYRG
jgi:choline-sulfatase